MTLLVVWLVFVVIFEVLPVAALEDLLGFEVWEGQLFLSPLLFLLALFFVLLARGVASCAVRVGSLAPFAGEDAPRVVLPPEVDAPIFNVDEWRCAPSIRRRLLFLSSCPPVPRFPRWLFVVFDFILKNRFHLMVLPLAKPNVCSFLTVLPINGSTVCKILIRKAVPGYIWTCLRLFTGTICV